MNNKKILIILGIFISVAIVVILFAVKQIDSKNKELNVQPVMTDESMPGMKH
jgi:ABC-type antimicrobial peptide transport system permease subunit